MSKILFHRVEVENAKSSYVPHDDLTFFLNAEGRALMKNSVRVEGVIAIRKGNGADTNANRIELTDDINIDNVIGINAIVDSCSVELGNIGLVEQFTEYSRYCKMSEIGEKDENDYHSGVAMAELKTPSEKGTQALIVGYTNDNTGATDDEKRDMDFSFKPRLCLNKMSDDLSFQKSGQIKLSLTLNRVNQVLYGINVNSGSNTGTTYYIKNLRVVFKSVPDEMNDVEMRTILSLKSSIDSQLSNTQSRVPAVVSGVSCCFLRQNKENDAKECNTSMDVLEGISELQFLFQDSTSQYISYVIDSKAEMIDKFIESLENSGHNQVNSNKNIMNFGIGVSFPPVDLSNQKFNIQINSNFSTLSSTPYIIYQYFHSFVSV